MTKADFESRINQIHLLEGNYESRQVAIDKNWLVEGPSQKIRNHSPDGFSWGYSGSGPAQLALAVCLKLLGKDLALKVYQDFKFNFISLLPQTDFSREFKLIDHIKFDVFSGEVDVY